MSTIQKGIDIIKVDVNKNQETLIDIVDKIRTQPSTTTSSNSYDLSLLKVPVANLEELNRLEEDAEQKKILVESLFI